MDFTDLASRYLQSRMDTATRPFTDPSGYAQDRFNSAFPGTTMETEEERRKRLEREAAERGNTEIASTTVKSYADGSQEEVKKTQIPAPVAPAAQPAPAQPVDPDTYQRMLQVESGNRQFNPQGGVLTSPKGAMGVGQVMPSTAMQPGYGVSNIFDMAQQRGMPVAQRDEATARQLLGNESLNRDFGQSYFNAMQQRFPQDPAASVAAYNAGPGRVGQNMQANAGQLNRGQLPQETQAYIQSVLDRQGQPAPQAQASAPAPAEALPPGMTQAQVDQARNATEPTPTQAVAPDQQPPVMIAGTPSSDVGLTPTEQAINQQRAYWATDLEKAQNDSTSLYAIAGNKERYPEEVRNIARDKAVELDSRKAEEEKARKIAEKAATGDPKATNDLMRAIKTKSEDGSYVKAYLFSRLGLNQLAQEEQSKLSGSKFGQALVDGKQYFVETKGGAITGAFNDTGARITDDATLAKINANYVSPTKSDTGADVFYNPMVTSGARFAKVNTPTGATFREIGTGRPATAEEQAGLVKMSSAGPIEQQAAAAYAKSGAGQQGKQAAEEGVGQGALPARTTTGAAPGGVATAPAVSNTSTAVIPNPNQPSAGATAGGSFAERKIGREVGGKRAESFNKIIDTEYREGAANGDIIVENRKKQYDILNRIDPGTNKGMAETISGLYTAANEDPGNQKLTIIRDILTGKVGKNEDEVSQRIAQLNISPAAKSALQEYNALNAQIAGRTLRETAGPGAVSDAEQAANRARNVDITKAPMLGAYNMMGQSQFSGDIQRYKADLAATTTAPNATTFDRDFRKTQTELVKAYREVTEARLDYINKNGGATNPAAIRDGYKKYPVPEYDVSTGNWKYLKPLDKIFK
jgi:hypothetical protein